MVKSGLSVRQRSIPAMLYMLSWAASQVLKFSEDGKQLLALGEALVPGRDAQHFCKPTAVSAPSTAACSQSLTWS